MKPMLRVFLLIAFLFTTSAMQSQILISLLFGEALNSDKIEFGLEGGVNRSYIHSISDAEGMNNFNLGFYFHIQMKKNAYLSTGVNVKSNVGATGMKTYALGDPDFDSLYKDGILTKKIPVFYVPILWHQRFNNRWYIEAGPQVGLIHQAEDIFETSQLNGELTYTTEVKDQYEHIDLGISGGVGYKFKKQIKSMAVGVHYYYGLLDVSKTPDAEVRNSSVNFYIKIPIGVGKAPEKE